MEDIEEFETSDDEEILWVTYLEEEKHLGEGGEIGDIERVWLATTSLGSPTDINKTI